MADNHGTQASILSSVLGKGAAAGAASSAAAAAAMAAAASTTPAEMHAAAQRALLQARQLASVMENQLDRTVAAMWNESELACADSGVVLEALRARLGAFRELTQKQGRLEEAALGQLAALAKYIQDERDNGMQAAAAEVQRLTLDHKRLQIKSDALERQVQLLSSAAHAPSSPTISSSEGDGNAAEVDRLRRKVEEQEELLRGLRTTLRDVCMKRDLEPVFQERDALAAELAQLSRAHGSLQEEKAALERLCSAVQGQLGRTASRCQELEGYVRYVEQLQHQTAEPSPSSSSSEASDATATTSPATTTSTSSSLASSPRRPAMVHDPGFDRSGDDGTAGATADGPSQQDEAGGASALLQWLLSFFFVFDDVDEEPAEEGAADTIVV